MQEFYCYLRQIKIATLPAIERKPHDVWAGHYEASGTCTPTLWQDNNLSAATPHLSLAASVFRCIYVGVHRCSTKRKNTITASVTANVSVTIVNVIRTTPCSKYMKSLLKIRSGPSQQAFRSIHPSTFSECWPTCFTGKYIFLMLCRHFDHLPVLSNFS